MTTFLDNYVEKNFEFGIDDKTTIFSSTLLTKCTYNIMMVTRL